VWGGENYIHYNKCYLHWCVVLLQLPTRDTGLHIDTTFWISACVRDTRAWRPEKGGRKERESVGKTNVIYTGILFLARRSKYHLSIWPLSWGELIPRLDDFISFLVSQLLLQVLSRSFAPLPSFLDFSSFFPHPGRGIFSSLPRFTTHACFLERCAQCCWVNILSTHLFCGLLHSLRQGISRFPQIRVVFLIFKKIVPLLRKHKIFNTPSLSFDQ